LYNATNALATYACADQLGVAPVVATALAHMQAAFGRYEVITAGTHQLVMALIKNPVGASETIAHAGANAWVAPVQLLIIINDRDADGTDVSWLWDADFERLCGTTKHVIVSGTRAADMHVRMQYAGIDGQQIQRIDRIAEALDAALAATPARSRGICAPLPTRQCSNCAPY
jgi:UDP-N-acetylmuramyl tripeptide synthase